jgi:glutathione S-transferase
MTELRIFSYLPNPRIWKATIAARLCGVEIELRGSSPQELQDWLWDFDARPLSEVEPQAAEGAERIGRVGFTGGRLFKTDAFLRAHPFGTVPAAFSPDGQIGIFESNSIMRAVARLGHERFALYGHDPYEASRIDGFLDASLVFARDAQIYLFALREPTVLLRTSQRRCNTFATNIKCRRMVLISRGRCNRQIRHVRRKVIEVPCRTAAERPLGGLDAPVWEERTIRGRKTWRARTGGGVTYGRRRLTRS